MQASVVPYSSQTAFSRVLPTHATAQPNTPLTETPATPTEASVARFQALPEASAQALLAFVDVPETAAVPTAPDFKAIAQGAVMKQGQQGPAVEELKHLLKALGYSVGMNAQFGAETAARVADFQADMCLAQKDSPYSGKVGPQTLAKMQALKQALSSGSETGRQLAKYAAAHKPGTTGACYEYVANAIDAKVGRFLSGLHAYMAADQLAQHPRFQEVKLPASKLSSLPAGAVVVWGKGSSKSGHISIANGKGQEISDHQTTQMTYHYGGAAHRVFMPLD